VPKREEIFRPELSRFSRLYVEAGVDITSQNGLSMTFLLKHTARELHAVPEHPKLEHVIQKDGLLRSIERLPIAVRP
jgi:hypothetical protein